MTISRNVILLSTIIFCSVSIDFVTKLCAKALLFGNNAKYYLDGSLTLLYAENPGAMLSLGAQLNQNVRDFLFIGLIASCLLAWTVYLAANDKSKRSVVSSSLIIGGGFGNLLSRIINDGKVVDFIHLDFGIVTTGVFNLADMLIILGLILLLVHPSKLNSADTIHNDTKT